MAQIVKLKNLKSLDIAACVVLVEAPSILKAWKFVNKKSDQNVASVSPESPPILEA